MTTAACVDCRYDLSNTPGNAVRGWRCSECGRLNTLADLTRRGWEWWKGWMFVPRIFAALSLSVLNLVVLAAVAFSLKNEGGFAAGLAVACGLCLVEGMCWVAVTRHGAPRFPVIRGIAVSAMLAGSGVVTLVLGVVVLLQNYRCC